MARYSPIKNSFVSGAHTPRLEARDDLEQYFQGLRQAQNGVVLPYGGFMRRSGSRFVAAAKTSTTAVALLPFQVSTEQAYVVEAGNLYFRFFLNEGRLENPPTVPVEVVTPYTAAHVSGLAYAQSADVMYVVHPSYYPRKLQRTSATSFTLSKVAFSGGRAPLRPENLTATTLTPSGAGPYTLTWSVSIGLTTGADVGRAVRHKNTYYEITAVSSGSVATANRLSGTDTGAETDWALGLFSDTEGPAAVEFHEGRLAYGGAPSVPDWLVLSVSDDFDNFQLMDPAASDAANADKSIAKRVLSKQVNAIRWLASADDQLVVGTSGGEFRVFASGTDDVLTPTTTSVHPSTSRGSAAVQPVVVDADVVFVQKNSRRIRRYGQNALTAPTTGFRSSDLTILAENLFAGGVGRLAYQQDPDSVIWAAVLDGDPVGITYEVDQRIVGCHRHHFGDRKSDQVESIAVIESPGTGEDQLWLVVKRVVNGSAVRYIEFVDESYRPILGRRSTTFEKIDALEGAFFVDSGLSLNAPVSITGFTNASQIVVTAASHGLSNGDRLKIRGVEVLVGGVPVDANADNGAPLNRYSFKAANVTANTFELTDISGNPISSSTWPAYAAGGTVRKEVSVVSGLSHLEGRTVSILADGAAQPQRVVSAGSVTLARPASIIHVGLGSVFFGETNRFVGGGRMGTDQGKKQRISRVAIRLHDTMGGKVGVDNGTAGELETLVYNTAGDLLDLPPPLFRGDMPVDCPGGWGLDPTVYFENDLPLPMTVLGLMPWSETNEQ